MVVLTVLIDAAFAPAVQQTLFSQAYGSLRRAIITGMLLPGQRVNEAEVARRMRISRGPIREAIRQLEQDGLLVSIPRRGTVVVSLTQEDIEEVYTLRADLEARAIQRAASRLTTEGLARLEELLERMDAAGAVGDLNALLDADLEFHRTLVNAAGWSQLLRIWESLHPRTLTLYTMRILAEWSPPTHAGRHRPVLEALRCRDPEMCVLAIREHIMGVGAEIIRLSQSSLPHGGI